VTGQDLWVEDDGNSERHLIIKQNAFVLINCVHLIEDLLSTGSLNQHRTMFTKFGSLVFSLYCCSERVNYLASSRHFHILWNIILHVAMGMGFTTHAVSEHECHVVLD